MVKIDSDTCFSPARLRNMINKTPLARDGRPYSDTLAAWSNRHWCSSGASSRSNPRMEWITGPLEVVSPTAALVLSSRARSFYNTIQHENADGPGNMALEDVFQTEFFQQTFRTNTLAEPNMLCWPPHESCPWRRRLCDPKRRSFSSVVAYHQDAFKSVVRLKECYQQIEQRRPRLRSG